MNTHVVDDLSPEVVAMLQALYSRSPKSVHAHLKQVKAKGADKFMATYYVGYNHKSIGDCGSTTMFAENVSMLAAKAVQDTPLYNGQEASTRYLDMTKQEVLNPMRSAAGARVQNEWMRLYGEALESLVPTLKERFPLKPEEKADVWEKAIRAKAFDIARSLLPAGATTNVSWHANLRQAYDHLKELRNHPLHEVRDLADVFHVNLTERYPSSFSHTFNVAEEEYIAASMERFAYYDGGLSRRTLPVTGRVLADFSRLDLDFDGGLSSVTKLLASRPPRTELHQRLRRFGTITFTFPLDFGSYRDLQRQRSAVQEMPLLTTDLGFLPWYIENLPPKIVEQIGRQKEAVERLEVTSIERQYYVAMGFAVPVIITCSLPSAVYIAELRSGKTVHPTLRRVAQQMGDLLERRVTGLTMHHDRSPDEWSITRGKQDIVEVKS